MRVSLFFTFAVAGLLAAGARADRSSAKEAFASRFTAVGTDGLPSHPECFPAALVERRSGWTAEKTAAWRAAWGRRLSKAKVGDVRERKDEAVARIVEDKSAYDVALRWDGTTWVLAAAEPYLVAGAALDRANGKKNAHVRLATRTEVTKGYGASAYSFSHVSADMEKAKGRADVWYCHNGELHPSGDGRIVGLGEVDWKKSDGIPTGAWTSDAVPVHEGETYVVHCRRSGRYDFHAILRVTKAGEAGLEFDWRLLTVGEGAPESIGSFQPPKDRDGADGVDGLCAKD